ncbi:MAG: DUF3108 domain-containing protein [Bacteroidales bacterium]|nr:DUF3108 domain-containing protein [Bacteroidales bacterium]
MNKLFILIVGLILSLNAISQDNNILLNNAFQRGEKLTFKLYYRSAVTGNVNAGELISEVKPNRVYIANKPAYHIVMEGRTKGAFNWFFKIRDRFETYMNELNLRPLFYKKRIQEGDYKTQREVRFNQETGIINYHNLKNGQKGIVNTTVEVQDLVSSLYYIRNWDFNNFSNGHKFQLNVFLDDSVYQVQFEYIGKETIKTNLGKISCIKFKPKMLTGGVFEDESPMTVYVSDDKNHLPILVVSEVAVGSVRMELKEYSGIKYRLDIK